MGKNWTGNNRAPWQDYRQRQIYLITLKKLPEIPPFGSIAGDWRLPQGTPGRSYTKASPLGAIIKSCLRDIATIHPALRIYQYALMPDHIHIILSVEAYLDEVVGRKLAAFKVMANKRANLDQIFERGFNDQILTSTRNLDSLYIYLRENPYRLAVRIANPEYFSRINQLNIGGVNYAAYGNIHLLMNPFKEQVIVHRADDAGTRQANRQRWLHTGSNGGVIVSPFISPAEKAIRKEAEDLGTKIILITHEAFTERYKPAAHDFALCAEGRLLIITLSLPHGTALTRSHCLRMNQLAAAIAALALPPR